MAAAQPLKIRMVAGLGNPGDEYAETRHNAGFKAIDELARQAGVTYWKNQAGAEVALININDPEEEGGKRQIVVVKPQSYMNTSGGPISKLCREYKIKAEDIQDNCARAADAAGLAIVHGVIYARDHVNGAASANGKH